MKQYLLIVPIIALMAAGCGSREPDNLPAPSVDQEVPGKTPTSTQSKPPVRPQVDSTPSASTAPTNTTSGSAPKPVEEAPKSEPTPNTYTLAQVQSANSKENCWSIVSGNVYNLTAWIDQHPGGSRAILNMCGKDATDAFVKQHGGQKQAESALAQYKIGPLSQ